MVTHAYNTAALRDDRLGMSYPYYVHMVDVGLSRATSRAWYVLACVDLAQASVVASNANRRADMRGVIISPDLPVIAAGDRQTIVTPKTASRWYEPGQRWGLD